MAIFSVPRVLQTASEAWQMAANLVRSDLSVVQRDLGTSRADDRMSASGNGAWKVQDRLRRAASRFMPFSGGHFCQRLADAFKPRKSGLEGVAMRNERIFSKGGFYSFVVKSDALIHTGAVTAGRKIVGDLVAKWPEGKKVRVLDLACGSLPISISEIMAGFPERSFSYTGVDVNPDQVSVGSHDFQFPGNVASTRFLEGNAWDLDPLGIDEQFDVIFSGLNFHHATPEELYYLAMQVQRYLSPGGVMISHDIYRPAQEIYVRRPDVNPHNLGESLVLVPRDRISAASVPHLGISGRQYSIGQANWRDGFLEKLNAHLQLNGATDDDIRVNTTHVLGHDFPVSIPELRMIMDRAGFSIEVQDYGQDSHLTRGYIAVLAIRRR